MSRYESNTLDSRVSRYNYLIHGILKSDWSDVWPIAASFELSSSNVRLNQILTKIIESRSILCVRFLL